MIGLVDGSRLLQHQQLVPRAAAACPASAAARSGLEDGIGIEHPVDFIEDQQLSRREKLRRLPGLARAGCRLAWEFRRRERSIERFLADFAAQHERDRPRSARPRRPRRAARRGRAAPGDVRRLDRAHPQRLVHVAQLRAGCASSLEPAFGDDAAEMVVGLLSGEDAIESKEPTRRLIELAQMIRADADLERRCSTSNRPREALAELRERSRGRGAARSTTTSSATAIAAWASRSSRRSRCARTPRSSSRSCATSSRQEQLDPDALDRASASGGSNTSSASSASLGWRRRRRRAPRARQRPQRRQGAREHALRAHPARRPRAHACTCAVGERLHEAGLLDDPRDVFYLTAEELTAYHEGRSATAGIAALARLRKAEFAAYEQVELPNQFETFGSPYHGPRRSPTAARSRERAPARRASGCCPGHRRGGALRGDEPRRRPRPSTARS